MIKNLRVQIDGLHRLTLELKPNKAFKINFSDPLGLKEVPYSNSKEIETAAEKLIYAKAWLGKCLQEMGVESPYKSGYKTVADIEPTADTNYITLTIEEAISWKDKSHVEKVDWLRTEIEKLTGEVKSIYPVQGQSREFAIARTNAYNYLCEARFALGFELQRLKEENK